MTSITSLQLVINNPVSSFSGSKAKRLKKEERFINYIIFSATLIEKQFCFTDTILINTLLSPRPSHYHHQVCVIFL